jgi:3-isopropylmalate dehydrogenase
MQKQIALLPGDGIGPEVTRQAQRALEAVAETFGHRFSFSPGLLGAVAIDATGEPLPDATLEACRQCDAILLGAVGDPKYDNDPNAPVRPEQGLLRLRKELGLYANIRPVVTYDALVHLSPLRDERVRGADLVIFRELTGGIYFGEKRRSDDRRSAFDGCAYSDFEIERIAHRAFLAARQRRNKVTLVDKANVLETSRLWREVVRQLAADHYPDVALEFLYVDNAAMQLIQHPRQFDVVLTENMFGDILSDEASVLTGSLGLLPSASIGARTALFEPIHGSYPQAAGRDVANPMAAILSAAMLLDYFELPREAALVRAAVQYVLDAGAGTEDLQCATVLGTTQVGELIELFIRDRDALQRKKRPLADVFFTFL